MTGIETKTALTYLDSLYPQFSKSSAFRFQVQDITEADSGVQVISGIVAGGSISIGDEIMVAASLKRSQITQISAGDSNIDHADSGDSVSLRLSDDINIKPGDVLHIPGETLQRSNQFQAHLVWMTEDPMLPERSYLMEIGPQTTSVQITDLKYAINVESSEHLPATKAELNEIAVCNFASAKAIAFDAYADNQDTGAFTLIDRISRKVVGAGRIDFGLHRGQNLSWQSFEISRDSRAAMKDQKPMVVWFTGLSASGKSTIADIVEQKLADQNRHTYLLDGDNFRHGLNKDLGFTDADRVKIFAGWLRWHV